MYKKYTYVNESGLECEAQINEGNFNYYTGIFPHNRLRKAPAEKFMRDFENKLKTCTKVKSYVRDN